MATPVKIPPLGESISSGIIAAWHVQDGDIVSQGQLLFDLETDKITSEGQAEVGGKITLKAKQGDEVSIGQIVAEIDQSVKAPATAPASTPAQAPSQKSTLEPTTIQSPAVKRIAAETGLNPASIEGSGKAGRVTKGDMLSALESKVPSPIPTSPSAPAAPIYTGDRTSRKKMSPMRKRIAERLVAAQHEAAMLTTFNEVDMSAVMELRKKHQDAFVKKHGIKLGFMSFFVKAAVHALQLLPEINAQIEGDEIIQNHFYDIGVAVGGPKGLMVPVIRDCDELSFSQVEGQIVNYAQKVKDGKLSIEEMMGGVFTITNGGIYGSMLSTPILNSPQSAILGMHNIVERPVAINGEIKIRPIMYLALSYDHRVVDGKEAVTFLKSIKDSIEDPSRLLLSL